jgi:predicted Rossmann fold nucleotide-binding protein DprA/Smf involved in DNA uptake
VDEPLPFVGDVAPVRAPSRSPTTKKKAKARKRPRSAALDTQVFAQVQTFGPCSCAAVQKALGIPNSTVYTSLVRLVEAGKLVKDGDTYRVVPTLQGA